MYPADALYRRSKFAEVQTLRTQDTSDITQFGTISLVPKCLGHVNNFDDDVSVLITLSDLERQDRSGQIFQADLLNNNGTKGRQKIFTTETSQ